MPNHAGCCLTTILIAGLVSTLTTTCQAQVVYEEVRLFSDEAQRYGEFGAEIALDGNVLAVGAPGSLSHPSVQGAAFLIDYSSGQQIARLLSDDGSSEDYFGMSLALRDGVVAVGAPFHEHDGIQSGAIYLFDAATGAPLRKLLPSDGIDHMWFGFSVALTDGLAVVGAPDAYVNGVRTGAAYIFEVSTGNQVCKLVAHDGQRRDQFGLSVAMDRGLVAVGAPRQDDRGEDAGAVYLFDASSHTEVAKLTAGDGTPDDRFGRAVDVHGDTLAVGAYQDDENGARSGAVYLFDTATLQPQAKLFAPGGGPEECFGYSVSIDGTRLAVGALFDNAESVGAAYVFDLISLEQVAELRQSEDRASNFAGSIAMQSSIVLVGAPRYGGPGPRPGAVFVFDTTCPADISHDRQLGFADVQQFLEAHTDRRRLADWNSDRAVDFYDVLSFLADYSAGCW